MPEINLDTNIGRSLEQLVDHNGLRAVVEALAAIAYAKADHIEEAWQDRALARLWQVAARRVATAAESTALWRLDEQNFCKAMGARPEPDAHPDTDAHRAGCVACMKAYDVALPDGEVQS